MLLSVTEVSKELRINLSITQKQQSAYSLHAASTLTKRLLNTILVVLNTLVTGGVVLLLDHSINKRVLIDLWKESLE